MMDMRLPHLLLFTLESILRLTLRHGKTETLLSYSQYFSTIQTYSTIDNTMMMVMIFFIKKTEDSILI